MGMDYYMLYYYKYLKLNKLIIIIKLARKLKLLQMRHIINVPYKLLLCVYNLILQYIFNICDLSLVFIKLLKF